MEKLFERHDEYVSTVPMEYVRSMMDKIDWSLRLIAIKGPKGVGKSTLMLQYIKRNFTPDDRHVLYCSADTSYFSNHTLVDVADTFCKHGGTHLFIDEIHKYENWSGEIKEIYDLHRNLHIIISGSSLMRINDGQSDLLRRIKEYAMPGLSFREYLWFEHGLKIDSLSLEELLANLVKNREIRNLQIIEKMREGGVNITLEEMQADFPNTVLGRPHFAAELVKKKVVKTRQQAFDRYLAKRRPWYVARVGSNLDEAIVAIKESGGIPVIAHPMSLYLSWGKLPDALQNFYERGVMGLEAFHPGARVTECLRLEELAQKIGYFVTAGSDFHGEKIRADRKLGHTCGGRTIEDEVWDKIKDIIL